MPVLIATTKAADANSYLTVARANRILDRRLYAVKWFALASTPNAESYLVNGTPSIGATTVPVDTGSGTWTVGCELQLDGDETIYTVTSVLTGAGSLKITPALVAAPGDNTTVTRLSANEREKALIWATTLLDSMLVWNGTKRTAAQRLRWPRSGVTNQDGFWFDYDTIPELLEVVTAELALTLSQQDKFKLPGILGQGVSSVQLGPLRADVDSTQRVDVIPENLLAMLGPLGYLDEGASLGASMLPLTRT